MQEFVINEKDKMVMKLLHYFITEQSYSPVILHGAKDEIWLENLESPYKIIRIVSNYIHNEEQYEYDLFRAQKILKSIRKKIMAFKVEALSIFVDINENVKVHSIDSIDCISVHKEKDITSSNVLLEVFPDMKSKLKFDETGIELFAKITSEINEKSEKDAKKAEDIFSPKKPIVTRALILINTIVMALSIVLEQGLFNDFALNRPTVLSGEYYRIFTAMFLHVDIWHFLMNNYTLYVIGSQVESFYGKGKYLLLYLFSGLCGSLLSLMFLPADAGSVGASGAIFGILGALIYFGYHYRVYFGNVLRSQIIPLTVANLLMGLIPGIDGFAHLGGIVGGTFMAMAVGVKGKKDKINETNGLILCIMYIAFMAYMLFFR